MRKPEDVRVFGMADGVSEKYSNAVAAGAGMLGKTEGELVETLTVNVEPGGALSPGSTIVPLIPPVEGNVVESSAQEKWIRFGFGRLAPEAQVATRLERRRFRYPRCTRPVLPEK
ncbi:MAG: hypothetical protein ACXVAW_17550 [Vulcanimicrobiaceae bacterium]